jgi:hypothetical protein
MVFLIWFNKYYFGCGKIKIRHNNYLDRLPSSQTAKYNLLDLLIRKIDLSTTDTYMTLCWLSCYFVTGLNFWQEELISVKYENVWDVISSDYCQIIALNNNLNLWGLSNSKKLLWSILSYFSYLEKYISHPHLLKIGKSVWLKI